MTLRYSPRAQNDLSDIFRYLDERSPTGAINVMRAIYASVAFLAEHPHASQETNRSGVSVKIEETGAVTVYFTFVWCNARLG